MLQPSQPATRRLPRHGQSGQSITEFALVVPVLLLLVLAIADFGRLYTSAVAVEAAGREAADFGSFDASYWDASLGNVGTTVNEMQRRACVAAAGSHLEGYATTDPVNNTTCTNPTFLCTLELGADSADCASSGGVVGSTDCSRILPPAPPCTVHVRMDYAFLTFVPIPLVPASILIVRESRFRISNLTPPP